MTPDVDDEPLFAYFNMLPLDSKAEVEERARLEREEEKNERMLEERERDRALEERIAAM
jgi:hypothetical protein